MWGKHLLRAQSRLWSSDRGDSAGLPARRQGSDSLMQTEQTLSSIYTLMCRSALNSEYYGHRLSRCQRLNTAFEVLIALGAAGSGISGLELFQSTPYGSIIWGAIAGASAILAIIFPFFQLGKRIERYSRLYAGHSSNYSHLLILVDKVKRAGRISDAAYNSFEATEDSFIELSKDDDPSVDAVLLQRCEERIRQRHPPADAWYPPPGESSIVGAPLNPGA